MILVDVEMFEMDGYVLIKNIKLDFCFEGVFVVMYFFLFFEVNCVMGKVVGVDVYVVKFDVEVLVDILCLLIE